MNLLVGELMNEAYYFSKLNEAELNEILEGKLKGKYMPLDMKGISFSGLPQQDQFYVVSKAVDPHSNAVQPVIVITDSDNLTRLFGRMAQLRDYLSPMTSWCHVMTPDLFFGSDDLEITPRHHGWAGAWVGACIAEAFLLVDRPLGELKIAACLATHSFALGRTVGLWPKVSKKEIVIRMDTAKSLFKRESISFRNDQNNFLKNCLDPIWESLYLATTASSNGDPRYQLISRSLMALHDSRYNNIEDGISALARNIINLVPEASFFEDLPNMPSGKRLQLFDKLVNALSLLSNSEDVRPQKTALALLAGAVVLVLAGGHPNLSLAESQKKKYPEILIWAYILGGIGEHRLWTSVFDGLGRLVARDILRPFRLNDQPMCDISFDEACVLVDPQLPEPLVHMKLKQSRVVTVSLIPGVNVNISFADLQSPENRLLDQSSISNRSETKQQVAQDNNPWSMIAEGIWPYIYEKIKNQNTNASILGRDNAEVKHQSIRSKKAKTKTYYPNKPFINED